MSYLSFAPHILLQRWRRQLALVRTRRALLNLTQEQLRDVGLSEAQALREAWRPVWDTDPLPQQASRHEFCSVQGGAQCSIWRPS